MPIPGHAGGQERGAGGQAPEAHAAAPAQRGEADQDRQHVRQLGLDGAPAQPARPVGRARGVGDAADAVESVGGAQYRGQPKAPWAALAALDYVISYYIILMRLYYVMLCYIISYHVIAPQRGGPGPRGAAGARPPGQAEQARRL